MADAGKLKRENTALLRQAMQNGSAGKNDLARLFFFCFLFVCCIPLVDAAPCSTG